MHFLSGTLTAVHYLLFILLLILKLFVFADKTYSVMRSGPHSGRRQRHGSDSQICVRRVLKTQILMYDLCSAPRQWILKILKLQRLIVIFQKTDVRTSLGLSTKTCVAETPRDALNELI